MQTRIRAFASAATPWGGQRHQATPELAMRLKTLGVVGAGQMGSGIAQLGGAADSPSTVLHCAVLFLPVAACGVVYCTAMAFP